MTLPSALSILARMTSETLPVSVDIEGGPGNITCIAFSRRPESALVVPFAHNDGESVWSESEEIQFWQAIRELIESPTVPKIAQNGTYDFFVLAWTLGIVVRNFAHDTILAWWECFPELDKGLDIQASILTDVPFYKPDKEKTATGEVRLKFDSDEEFWRYNGIDACVTFECWQKEMAMLSDRQKEHYRFNMSLMPAVLYMMLRGIRWDKERAKAAREKALREAWRLQGMIDFEACAQGWMKAPLSEALRDGVLDKDEGSLVRVVTETICKTRLARRQDVEEPFWQPMRWNGKKWVKGGRRIGELPEGATKKTEGDLSGELIEGFFHQQVDKMLWFKPVPRIVSKLVPVTPLTLDDCEEFILESAAEAWTETRKLWRRLARVLERKDREPFLGQLAMILGVSLNTGSTNDGGDAQVFLYDLCKLPRIFVNDRGQFSREAATDHKKRLVGEKVTKGAGKRISTSQQALDKLYAETGDVRVLWVLQLRRLRKVAADLEVTIDRDSRLRASISLTKETGRMAEKGSPLKTGLNRQALNKDLRHVCTADEGCRLYQLDLEGADSWTVAAECAALGDSTMLEDLKAGLKPAKILSLIHLLGPEVNKWDRGTIQARLKDAKMPGWLYPGAKSSMHGTCYAMGWKTLIDTVLKYSMADLPLELADAKPILLTKEQVEALQGAVYSRYPGVKKWHESMGKIVTKKGCLETSVGHVRKLLGRKTEIKRGAKVVCHDTLKEALASLPQFYTTFASKTAALRLWTDPENRREDGSLIVEPLLLVHDSLLSQARNEDHEFAKVKMKSWFENPIEIAGQRIVIPADGTSGGDWGMGEGEKL